MEKSHNNHSRICKICNKRFANGKAMGGHMRSHFAKLSLPPKRNADPKSPPSYSSFSSPMHSYHISQNYHEQLITAITDHHHHRAAVMINGGDTRSDSARSSPIITRRRSKRRRKKATVESVTRVAVAVQSPEHASSDSEICLAEEVAWNLISLSRGRRSTRMEDLVVHGDELEEEDDESFVVIQERARSTHANRGSYRCDTCQKLFRSYHALGGHRSSHKKMKSEEDNKEGSGSGAVEVVAGFKCPFCDKVFVSGQALGGHKKVHFAYLTVAAPTPPVRNSKRYGGDCLDLNGPADELSDGEVSIATAIEAAEAESSDYWS